MVAEQTTGEVCPLSAMVIAEMLGVPSEDRDR
jgi:hypothetical protein